MNRALPPGVSEVTMERAFHRFAAVVGPQWVFTSPEDVGSYDDPFSFDEPGKFATAGAVAPATGAEVQAIVRIAGELRVPLWTVSTGRNLAYGGAAPRQRGCVVLDLKRMRAIEVDEDLAYAVVEPGVSFFDLFEYLQKQQLRLWISSPAPGWGSVIGNALERGFGPMPYGDHAAQICGLEVVLADGSLLRTGMGAIPDAETFHLFKSGYGPALDGLFTQSNFGVVTRLGIWLMPQPQSLVLCEVRFARESDLPMAVDLLRPLRLSGTIASVASIRNAIGTAAGTSSRDQWWQQRAVIPDAVIGQMMQKLDMGWWNLSFALYGNPDVTALQLRAVERQFAAIEGARLSSRTIEPDALVSPDHGGGGSRAGVPGLAGFQLANWRGGAGAHVDFSPVCAARGADAMQIYQLARSRIEAAGLDFIGTFYSFGRAMALICAIVFDRSNASERQSVQALIGPLIAAAGQAGFGEYRTHIACMDEVAAQYSWNSGALLRISRTLKTSLDPRGILSPGKQGIWPESHG